MWTKTELTQEQTQQGVSDEVLVSIKGVEELKINVKIKGEKKEALLTLRQKPEHQSDTKVLTITMEILPEPTSNKLYGRKRISEKRTKKQAKTNKTEHGMEKRGEAKVKSKSKSTRKSQRYGYIKNHKKTVKNGQARTRERKSKQKPEAMVKPQSNCTPKQDGRERLVKSRDLSTSLKHIATSSMEKHTWNVGFVLFLLREEAQVSLTWIASLAIRVRSLSDPTAKNKDLMIRDDQRWMIDGS
ncbi:hypothetical protein Tco_1210829 [Tanacetum coccineum]